MLLLSAMELHSARLLCLDRACSYHPPLRCSDEPMTDPAEFWKPPSTIEICEAQYDLAKSILEFVVEVKDDCSVLEHLFFQVAQLLESVIVSAPSFRFEDSNAVYRVSRISEQHDRNEQHFVDVLINEQNSEEYIRKHHTLDHELLLRHSLTLLEDELYQSVECLFVRSRRYCRLPARPFDIMLSHPFGATFALTSVSVHFFPAKYVMCTWQREQAVASRASVAYVWIANVHIERPVNKPIHGHSRYSSLSSHNNNCGRSPRCCAMRAPTRPPSAFRCRSLQARFKSVRGGCTYHARVASDASSRLIDEYRCVVGSYEKHSSRIMPWRQKTSMPFNGLALREIKVGRVGLSRSVGATHSLTHSFTRVLVHAQCTRRSQIRHSIPSALASAACSAMPSEVRATLPTMAL